MNTEQTVYNGRDNTIELALLKDGVAIDCTALTRCMVMTEASDGTIRTLDSQSDPEWFDCSHADKVVMRFGHAALTAGRYKATLIVYDTSRPNGIVWQDFVMVVRDV